ncbi:MAG: hypothetical protein FJ206_13230 [Gemmatimonadetes bacterium]|nr:hypothetical protein [Gemmatimonadota bacterium]
MRAAPGLLALGLLGCGGGSAISVPRPATLAAAPIDSAIAFAEATTPAESRDIRIRWQFRDDQGAAGGQGRVRLARPDSARLDVRGPLGSGRAAAFVFGDTALWAEPEGDIKRLVPNYPLFWALLGVVRRPPDDASVRRYLNGQLTAWQFQRGEDTVDYVRRRGEVDQLFAEVRQGGKTVGTVLTVLGPDGRPRTARLVVPSVPARLDITFSSNELAKPFAPDTWNRPQP